MNGISIKVDLQGAEEIKNDLRSFIEALYDRTQLHESIAKDAATLTREHLLQISSDRHATAEALGADPSGFWGSAVEGTTFTGDNEAATVTIEHPGIGRAMHDRQIVPINKTWLTLALIAQAYNQRAYRVEGLFFVQPKGKDYALLGQRQGEGKDANVIWWYLLIRESYQQQDRSLLPSDEEYRLAALEGVRGYIAYKLFRREHPPQ